jgi:hypothetical protein
MLGVMCPRLCGAFQEIRAHLERFALAEGFAHDSGWCGKRSYSKIILTREAKPLAFGVDTHENIEVGALHEILL